MLLKLGVDISRLNKEIRSALNIIDRRYKEVGEEAVITSTYEGNHSPGSYHYSNDAIDIRKSRTDSMFTIIKEDLGKDFDVVSEYSHMHIEYDTKK